MPHLTTPDGVQLHYTDTGGDGRPLVLIHGWPMSGEAFATNVEAFTDAGHRVITYDRRGFGQSAKPDGGYDYDTLSSDTRSLLEQLDLHGAVVLGFSMGGGEAAHVGSWKHPRVAGIIFSGSITPALGQFDDNPDGAMPFSAFEDMSNACAADRDGFLDSFVTTYFSTADDGLLVDEATRADALRIAHQSGDQAAVQTILIWASDLREFVENIEVPVLVIHGDADQNVPVSKSAERMPKFAPQAKLVIIEGAPHGANITHHVQWESAILDFLETLD